MSLPLKTPRLTLRLWREEDLPVFEALNADPRVMEYFPAPLSAHESKEMFAVLQTRIQENGFGFWAAELKATGQCLGFIGLSIPSYPLPFSPCVEIGWRLAFETWGKGLATEGAQAALRYGFEHLQLKEIVAFTSEGNQRSRRVMDKLGMKRDRLGDFDHPKLPADHPLRSHVLYRIPNPS